MNGLEEKNNKKYLLLGVIVKIFTDTAQALTAERSSSIGPECPLLPGDDTLVSRYRKIVSI